MKLIDRFINFLVDRYEYISSYIMMICFLLIGFGIFVFSMILNNQKPVVVEPSCESVDGKTHIYRGQCFDDYYAPELVLLSKRASYLDSQQLIDIKAKVMVEQLILDAQKDGMCLTIASAYRSYDDQQKLYDRMEDKSKVAKAGESEHQTGLAVDFTACPMSKGVRDDSTERPELAKRFDELPEYKWLVKNAKDYGFVESYTYDNMSQSGYPAESWHWKLVIGE